MFLISCDALLTTRRYRSPVTLFSSITVRPSLATPQLALITVCLRYATRFPRAAPPAHKCSGAAWPLRHMVPYGRSILTTDPVNPSHQSNLPAFSLQQWLANANPSALGTLGPPTLIGPSRLSHNRFEMPPDSTAVSSTHALVHRASPSAVVLPTPRSRNMASYSCAQVFAQGCVMAPGASAAPSLRNPRVAPHCLARRTLLAQTTTFASSATN